MNPTNDAPVTVDDLTRPIVGIENRTAQEAFDIMADRIRSRLAAVASASAESLPDIGPDPFKGPRDDDRYEASRLRLRAAYVQQQTGVPDQTALVWRYDLGTVLEMAIRLKSILADDDETCTGCDGSGFDPVREAVCHCQPEQQPRAAVGEREA